MKSNYPEWEDASINPPIRGSIALYRSDIINKTDRINPPIRGSIGKSQGDCGFEVRLRINPPIRGSIDISEGLHMGDQGKYQSPYKGFNSPK